MAAKDTDLDVDISSLAASSTDSADVSSLAAKDTDLDVDISSLSTSTDTAISNLYINTASSTEASSLAAKDSNLETDISSLSSAMVAWDSSAPASPTSSGDPGDMIYDSNYLYVCVSNNTWRRLVLSEWN